MARMITGEISMPWIVVSDTNKDVSTLDGFCRGHMTEADAVKDAEDRTARAKELGKDWKYRPIVNPKA